jgi:hypothetical protein
VRNKTLIIRWLTILLIALLYGFSIYPYPDSWMSLLGISLALGFATHLGVSLIIEVFQNRRDAQLIKSALAGQRGIDGKSRAVLGKIYLLNVPISAPFSGRKCPIVSYDIYQQYWTKKGGNLAEPIIYSGYHQAPSEIRTGSENVKILGFPELSDVPEVETTSYGRIKSFIKQTDFTQPKGAFIEGVNELSKTIHVDKNGAAAEDFQFRQRVQGQSLKSREQIVKEGAEVCLIGIFDAARGGIVPDNRPFGRTMKLIPGTEKQVLSKLTRDSGIVVAFGIIVTVLCISIGLLPHAPDSLLKRIPAGDKLVQYRNEVLARNAKHIRQNKISDNVKREQKQPLSNKIKRKQEQPTTKVKTLNMTLLIKNGDVERLRKELRKGLDPDIHIPSGNGYSLPLIEAINFNQLEIARLLLKSGADINAVNSYMVNGLDAAISSRNTEAVKLLLGTGAEIYPGDAHRLSPLNRAILNQDVEILALLLEAGANPSPPWCDQYIATLPADSDKADIIRELLNKAREKRK